MNLKTGQLRLLIWEAKRKRNKEKRTVSETCGISSSIPTYAHNGTPKEKNRKYTKRIFGKIMTKNFTNFMKNINLHIQES